MPKRQRPRIVTFTTLLLVVVVLGGTGTFSIVGAQEQENSDPEGAKGDGDENIAQLRLAGELAQIGADTKDAVLLLAAARLEALASAEEVSRGKESEGGAAEGESEGKQELGDLYALAEEYAGTNEALQSLIANSRRTHTTRGASGGARVSYDSVLAHSTDRYRLTFRGGSFAEVSVVGDGDTDLDLYVYDEHGNRVCSDTGWSDRTYCSWRPRWAGVFSIEVRNLGSVYNRYRLATN